MTFLRNAWYCAGWSTDVSDTPISKTFLGEPVMLYRTDAGKVVALNDRCPHRFAPLHKGKRVGDAVACPYHGLEFDASGRCVRNPHGDQKIPAAAQVRAYPLEERQGVLWIWMGEPAAANPATIVDAPFMEETDLYAMGTGHLVVNANYQLVMDNLLDLTHGPYLHPNTLAASPEDTIDAGLTFKSYEDDLSITSTYLCENIPRQPALAHLFPPERGDLRITMQWQPASSLVMWGTVTAHGQPDRSGLVQPLLHLLTPIDDTHTHYFFAVGRNVELHNEAAQAGMMALTYRGFQEEDEPMIADCQRMMGTVDLFSLRPVLLTTDVSTVKARRRLQALIDAEQAR